jgi:hypothetical protein
MNCSKGHSISLFDVSSDLSIYNVWSETFLYIPTNFFHPFVRTKCWNCTIGVSGIEENSVFVF